MAAAYGAFANKRMSPVAEPTLEEVVRRELGRFPQMSDHEAAEAAGRIASFVFAEQGAHPVVEPEQPVQNLATQDVSSEDSCPEPEQHECREHRSCQDAVRYWKRRYRELKYGEPEQCMDPSVCSFPGGRCVEPSRCKHPKSVEPEQPVIELDDVTAARLDRIRELEQPTDAPDAGSLGVLPDGTVGALAEVLDTTTSPATTRNGEYHFCGKCGNDIAECIQAERDDKQAEIERIIETMDEAAIPPGIRRDVLAAIRGGDDA
jgi:hypothetical protein